MFGTANRPRWVVVADVVVLAVALVGLAVVQPRSSEEGGDPIAVRRPPETGTVPVDPSAPLTEPATPGSSGTASPTTTRPAGSASGAAAGPVPAPAAPLGTRDGTYESRVTAQRRGPDGKDRESEQRVVTKVSTTSRTEVEVRQDLVTTTDGKSPGSTQQVRWVPDSLYTALPSYTSERTSSSCSPAEVLSLRLPLAEGNTWASTVECSTRSDNSTSTSRADKASKVVASREVPVLGRSLPVWEIETTEKAVSRSSFGELMTETRRTALFSPELGIEVRLDEHVKVTGSMTAETRSTTELQKFDPS